MVTLSAGSAWSLASCVGVLGVMILKPAATSVFSRLFVLAQPRASARSAMTLRDFNTVWIGFIVVCLSVCSRSVCFLCSRVDSRAASGEAACAFHQRIKGLVACAYGLPERGWIKKRRHRVVRMLEIRIQVVRGSAGEALDVRILHDGFVKLHQHRHRAAKQPNHCHSRHSGPAKWSAGAWSPHR